MKSNKIKQLLAATLAVTMMMASTLTVAASGGSTGSTGSVGSSSEATESTESNSEATESSSVSVAQAPEVTTVSVGGTVSVAGTAVATTVSGAYSVKTLQGIAVTTPADTLKADLGLTGSQVPHVVAFDTDPKKSHLAMACVNAAATALGGDVVTALNIDLAAKDKGKIVKLTDGSAAMVTGLPKGADLTKTYYAVCVQPGGVITILKDQDASPATVTFEIKAGLGTYGIVAK